MRNDGTSQCDAILRALKSGDRITPLEALGRFGTLRLAARVAELREAGHAIETDIVEFNGKHVASYRMPRKRKAA
jgi:hypothetical protein